MKVGYYLGLYYMEYEMLQLSISMKPRSSKKIIPQKKHR